MICLNSAKCIPQNGVRNMRSDWGMSAGKILIPAVLCICCCAAQCQDAREMVRQDVKVELEADATDHSNWIFHDDDQKPGNDVVQWVAQTHQGNLKRVIERNGHKISKEQQRQSIEDFIHDSDAQAEQRQANQKDAQQAESLLKLLPNAFLWTEVSHNYDTTTFRFKPDPIFSPPSYASRVFAAMAGEMVVDNKQHRIEEFKGEMIHDVNFLWGILGSVKKGGWFEVDRQEVGPGIWEITQTHIHIHGHILFFKTISQQEDDVETSFSREPGDVTLEQAAAAVMKK